MKNVLYLLTVSALLVTARQAVAGSATWNSNPSSGDWNTAGNWTPATVPNGPDDVATLASSNQRTLSLSGDVEVGEVVFNAGASRFMIHSISSALLTISGAGITNNSGMTQQFVVDQNEDGDSDGLRFTNSATAGTNTMLTAMPGETSDFGTGGAILFQDQSSAGDSVIQVFGASPHAFRNGELTFSDNSTAGNGVISTLGFGGGDVGELTFFSASTAGNAEITNGRSGSVGGFFSFLNTATAGTSQITNLGNIVFRDSASLDQATITNIPNSTNGFYTGSVNFGLTSTAGSGTIVNQGGTAAGTNGAATHLTDQSTAGSATLIAEAGSNGGGGGLITFDHTSEGGQARVETFGNGSVDISGHSLPGVTIGSLEGDGVVSLGANFLNIGRSNLSTVFSGVIQGSGPLIKSGKGALTLTAGNTYTGGTTITRGTVRVSNTSGSATGSGNVEITGGILGGTGIIAGETSIGPGTTGVAILKPSAGGKRTATFTMLGALHFKGGALVYLLDTKRTQGDQVVANGVSIENQDQFNFFTLGNQQLTPGQVFVVISNTAAAPISGTFGNLPDGGTFSVGRNTFQANYEGGEPNGPDDVATLASSNQRTLSLSGDVEVGEVVFNAGASPFMIHSISSALLTISGAGITNNSGMTQQFVVDQNEDGDSDGLRFTNSATAGTNTMLTAMPGETSDFGTGGAILFQDQSSAGDSVIQVFGASPHAFRNGELTFSDNSTAGNAVISTLGFGGGDVGELTFFSASTAGNAEITNGRSGSVGGFFSFLNTATAGTSQITNLGNIVFRDSASLDQATITNIPNSTNGFYTGSVNFGLTSTAGSGTIVNQGGTAAGTNGAATHLTDQSTAGSATLIAEAGSNGGGGGLITFDHTSEGGQARVETFGNGSVDITGHSLPGVTIGSLEGDGLVSLGANSLNIGSSNLNTVFSGVIQGSGPLIKSGKGALTLTAGNTYTGGTTITRGTVRVSNTSGSATGSGNVEITGGILGGTGIIAGETSIGPGTTGVAILKPSAGGKRTATFTMLGALHFKGGALVYLLDTKRTQGDQVVANGVSIENQDQFNFFTLGNQQLPPGQVFVVISNTAAAPISGTFGNLPDGGTFSVGRNTFQANYEGGDGNDLTLTVIP